MSGESPGEETRREFSLSAGAVSDLPTDEDVLGFAPLVEGLRAMLNSRRTKLPLAIAITAPWGAGKSSVMLQLRKLLRDPGGRRPRERKWRIVDFPAWKYEHGEHLWAALAKAVYEQPQEEMQMLERVWFRVRVEQARLGWVNFLLKGAWPPILAGAAVLTAVATNVEPAGSPLLGAAVPVAAFLVGAAHYWGVATMPFKRAMERYASAPDYDEMLGFTADADRDIRSLARVLAPDTEEKPEALAVFVDDLDRCSSPHVVEMVEAMNQIFNSDGRHGCVFVLGLDREVVATSIEVAYGPTVESLRKANRPVGRDFGMHFLAKLVQITVTVPQPDDPAVERLLLSLSGRRIDGGPPVEGEDVDRVEREIKLQEPENLERVTEASAGVKASPEARTLGKRRVLAQWIEDSPDVGAAELEVLPHMARNPRRIKRFDNAFRLQLYVANEDPGCRLAFSFDQLVALARWVGLRLRWPQLAAALDEEPWLLAAIEASANDEPMDIPAVDKDRIYEEHKDWLEHREVCVFLGDGKHGKARRVSTLDHGSFLRVI